MGGDGCGFIAIVGAAPVTPGPGAPLGPAGPAGPGGQAQPNPFGGFFWILMGFLVLMIFMSMTAGRKEKRRRAEMMTGLKRHDRVRMAGGMLGIITDIRDDEVVVKVDESNNTRIRFARDAVQAVLKPSSESPTPEHAGT